MASINRYVAVHQPNHHRASPFGLVYEHILMAEKKIGRELQPQEVVHHIDQNRSNNDLDNLLVFATKADHTSFHHGKSYQLTDEGIAYVPNKGNYCIDCGIAISNGALRCKQCYDKYQQEVQRPSREDLKNLIRNYSFTQIGKIFNVSDNAIRKWCKAYSLPSKSSIIKSINDADWEKI